MAQAPGSLTGSAQTALLALARERLAQAASAGFHDTIWLLVVLGAIGLVAVLLLPGRQPAQLSPAGSTELPRGETC